MALTVSHRLLALAFSIAPAAALAQSWAMQFGATGRVEYNDNFFFTETDKQDAVTLNVTPFMAAVRRTDATEFVTLLTIGGNRVWGDVDLEYLTGRAQVGGRIFDERSVWSANAGYVRSLSLQNAIGPQGLVYAMAFLDEVYANGSYTRALTERWSVGARINIYDNTYDRVEDQLQPLVDNQGYGAGASAFYQYDERTTLSFSTDYAYTDSDTDTSNTATATLGASWRYSPELSFSLSVGYFWDRRDTDVPPAGRYRTSGSLFGGGLTYQVSQQTQVTLNAAQRLNPSATGEVTLTDSIDASVAHRLDERWTLRASASYSRDRLEAEVEGVQRSDLFAIGVGAAWRIDPSWTLDMAYQYQKASYENDQGSPKSNVAFVSIAYNMPDATLETGGFRLGPSPGPGAGPVVPPLTTTPPAAAQPFEIPTFEPLLLP